ncbi:hypothetical protein WISP_121722 [Willisornis vidua]|uniref:Uncharacterized protein n=1 Tax=Willisornis vidua TaxID=1566151 RepID=A0ABQ9CTC6_9PASS|nr:hypothetical protein WISP_121722 [Willisornis vidua]
MVLVHHLLLILLTALHARAVQAAPGQVQEAADSLKESLAAWQKDGLEPLGQPADLHAGGLLKSLPVRILKQKREPTVLSKPGEKRNGNANKPPQTDSKHSEVAGGMPTHVSKPKDIESIFCQGAGCMIGIVIVLVAVPVGILLCTVAICWWCERKRRLSGDRQERVGLISRPDSQTSLSELQQP